jgi:hypothetical protein
MKRLASAVLSGVHLQLNFTGRRQLLTVHLFQRRKKLVPVHSSTSQYQCRRKAKGSLWFALFQLPDANETQVMYALTKIKGVGRRYSNLVCKKADVDLNKRYG